MIKCNHSPKLADTSYGYRSFCIKCEKFLCPSCNGKKWTGLFIGRKVLNKKDCAKCNATGIDANVSHA